MDPFEIEQEEEHHREESPNEKLFEFLYKVGKHHRHPEALRMFNCNINIEEWTLASRNYI